MQRTMKVRHLLFVPWVNPAGRGKAYLAIYLQARYSASAGLAHHQAATLIEGNPSRTAG